MNGRMGAEKSLWEVRFIVEGVQLPKTKVSINKALILQKLDEKEQKYEKLLVRAYVNIEGNEKDIVQRAARLLNDFLNVYTCVAGFPTRIVRDDGASQISGFTGFGASISRSLVITVVPKKSNEELNQEIKVARRIFDSINFSSKSKGYLRVALDYFRKANNERLNDNKLIDYMIALEALYLSERLELSYRLSHRVSCLLGENDKKRAQIFKDIKSLYKKRSNVVHGEHTDILSDEVSKLKEYVKDSIQRFLVLATRYPKNKILEILDESVINKDTRERIQRDAKTPSFFIYK